MTTQPHARRAASPRPHNALDEVAAGNAKLHDKTDAFFAAVVGRHRLAIRCAPGCATCCQRTPSLLAVEAWTIARHLVTLDPRHARGIVDPCVRQAHAGEASPCPMLDHRGHCQIYAVRPVSCRSLGAPVRSVEPAAGFACCALNFAQRGQREAVQPGDVLDVERLNSILVVVDDLFRQAFPGGEQLPERMPLAQGVMELGKRLQR